MTRILTHVHVFYPEIWPEIKSCLRNMEVAGVEWDLFVTMVEDHAAVREDIHAFKPDADIRLVENKGYDVWPFLSVLQSVNLDDYDFVVKLHTKRDMPNGSALGLHPMGGGRWRKYAYSFLCSTKNFCACLSAFDTDPTLGMCADYRLILNGTKVDTDLVALENARALLKKMALPSDGFSFVAGTMFFARANIFAPLLKQNLSGNDFVQSSHIRVSSLAHTLERVLGGMVLARGCRVDDVFTSDSERYLYDGGFVPLAIRRFLWQAKVTKSGRLIVKIFKIPVYFKRKRV